MRRASGPVLMSRAGSHFLEKNGALKAPATRNDFVNDLVSDARADAIFATLKAVIDDDDTSTISLRVAWHLLAIESTTDRR